MEHEVRHKLCVRINSEAYPKNIVEIFGMFTQGVYVANCVPPRKMHQNSLR